MKPKFHVMLYTFLGIALVLAIVVGVQYAVRADDASKALEDGYTQRLLETQEHLQAIGLKLDKAPIASDARQQTELLTGVTRQADAVVAGLSSLPLSHVAMSDTVKFCNQLSEYTMALALSSAEGDLLDEEDARELSQLRNQCMLLLGQFATAREQMLAKSLQITAQGNVFYQEAQLTSRPLEQVGQKDGGMDYPTMIYDGAFSDARHNGTPKALGMERVTAEQAVSIATQFVGQERVKSAASSGETEGSMEAFGVVLQLNDGTQVNAEVTKTGGKLLMMMPEHASFAQTLTLSECEEKGGAFLRGHGYDSMEANHFQVYDGLAVINYVAVQDGALLYPDLVKLQLRMDTGEVVGMEAGNYLMNHHKRSSLTPTLTPEQALARVSDRLKPGTPRLCVIPYRDGEQLCYEVGGTYQDNQYLVYIDALTGEVTEILQILQTTDGVMSA